MTNDEDPILIQEETRKIRTERYTRSVSLPPHWLARLGWLMASDIKLIMVSGPQEVKLAKLKELSEKYGKLIVLAVEYGKRG